MREGAFCRRLRVHKGTRRLLRLYTPRRLVVCILTVLVLLLLGRGSEPGGQLASIQLSGDPVQHMFAPAGFFCPRSSTANSSDPSNPGPPEVDEFSFWDVKSHASIFSSYHRVSQQLKLSKWILPRAPQTARLAFYIQVSSGNVDLLPRLLRRLYHRQHLFLLHYDIDLASTVLQTSSSSSSDGDGAGGAGAGGGGKSWGSVFGSGNTHANPGGAAGGAYWDSILNGASPPLAHPVMCSLAAEYADRPNVVVLRSRPITYMGVSMLLSTVDALEALKSMAEPAPPVRPMHHPSHYVKGEDQPPIFQRGSSLSSHSTAAAEHAAFKAEVAASAVEWDYFINLSAGDYPLLSPMAMATLYGNLKDHETSFISVSVQKYWPPGWTERVRRMHLDPGLWGLHTPFSDRSPPTLARSRRWNRDLEMPSASIGPDHPASLSLAKAEAWMALPRSFVDDLVFTPEARWLLSFLSHAHSSDEVFFPTLAQSALKASRQFEAKNQLKRCFRNQQKLNSPTWHNRSLVHAYCLNRFMEHLPAEASADDLAKIVLAASVADHGGGEQAEDDGSAPPYIHVNTNDLRAIVWEHHGKTCTPGWARPCDLTVDDFDALVATGGILARKMVPGKSDSLMDKIDSELLIYDHPPGDSYRRDGLLPPLATAHFLTHFGNVHTAMGGARWFDEFDYYGTTYSPRSHFEVESLFRRQ